MDPADTEDLITFLVRRVRELCPGLSDMDVFKMQREARQAWCGRRCYIRARMPATDSAAANCKPSLQRSGVR